MEWVKCETRLPELDKDVLLWFDNKPFIGQRWYDYDTDNKRDHWKWYIPHMWITNDIVTHWAEIISPTEK